MSKNWLHLQPNVHFQNENYRISDLFSGIVLSGTYNHTVADPMDILPCLYVAKAYYAGVWQFTKDDWHPVLSFINFVQMPPNSSRQIAGNHILTNNQTTATYYVIAVNVPVQVIQWILQSTALCHTVATRRFMHGCI